ncbi:MAG: ADP-ribosylation factor-directed GTPase activating protein isoform b [Planctomycetota bacterium]|jgi:hypothetical protein
MKNWMDETRRLSLARPVVWALAALSGTVGVFSWVGCQPSAIQVASPDKNTAENPASQSTESLQSLIDRTLAYNRDRRILSTERNAAWQVAHGSVAYGLDLPLQVGPARVLAFEHLLGGGAMRGWDLAAVGTHPTTKRPLVNASVQAGSYEGQGHVDQFLGYLSQTQPPLDLPILLDGTAATLEDWGRTAQWEVPNNPYREYSWTLIALTNLFPDDYEWKAADGNTWTLEPLVSFEAKQDLTTSPCGGMHRAMGLAHAVNYWKRRNMNFTGGWLEAQNKLRETVDIMRRYQNSDGTFSTNYTSRPGTSSDLSSRIGTTGHTLEVLAYALDKDELRKPWIEKSVRRLCEMLEAAKGEDLECGGLYHGLAGLRIYRNRVFGESQPGT